MSLKDFERGIHRAIEYSGHRARVLAQAFGGWRLRCSRCKLDVEIDLGDGDAEAFKHAIEVIGDCNPQRLLGYFVYPPRDEKGRPQKAA
jgi:hypothetical protein